MFNHAAWIPTYMNDEIIDWLYEQALPVDKSELAALVDQAQALNANVYTGASWSPLAAALTAAESVLVNDEADQDSVIRAAGALEDAIAALEVRDLAIDVVVGQRCIAGKAYLTVQASNGDTIPADLTITTAYGEKAFAEVAPGSNGYHLFTTRLGTLPSGSVTVDGAGVVGGAVAPTAHQVEPYAGGTC
jgi:hypothetical protein